MRMIMATIVALLLVLGAAAAQPLEPLPTDEAFSLSVARADHQTRLTWKVAPGYYLYRDHFRITRDDKVIAFAVSEGEMKADPGFGTVAVFFDEAVVTVPLNERTLRVTYQGCQDGGICYRPETRYVDLASLTVSATAEPEGGSRASQSTNMLAAAGIVVADDADAPSLILRGANPVWVAISFLGFGILLAFTPCVFPIYPIVLGMLGRQGERASAGRGFALSVAYVLSLAFAFALVGAIVGWTGQNIQLAIQSPLATLAMVLLFLVLAAASFGMVELQLPAAITSRVSALRPGQGGSLGQAAALGFTSSLIVGPCVTAPLAGALLYVAQGGDWRIGAMALFALGVGKGLPLIAMATFGGKLLPRAGRWMETVRRLFGFGFVAMAIWIATPLLPAGYELALYAILLLVLAGKLIVSGRSWWSRTAALFLAITSAGVSLNGMVDGKSVTSADARISLRASVPEASALGFRQVSTAEGLVREFEAADGKPIMVYVAAEWCVICRSIERSVLPDPEVAASLAGMTLVKLDVTEFNGETQALLRELKVAGPPTMLFFDGARREVSGTRLVGAVRPSALVHSVQKARAAAP